MSPELLTSLSAMLIGIIGAVTSLFLALRKRIAEEDVPALKKRVADLETLREQDRREYERRVAELERTRESDRADFQREIHESRGELLALDRRWYDFERWVIREGISVPENLRRLNPRYGNESGGRPPKA